MAFVAVPDSAKAVIRFSGPQGIWTNNFWFRKADFTPADQLALAAMVGQYWGAGIKTRISSLHTYVETVVYDMRAADGTIVSNNTGTGTGSMTATGPVPISAAMVLTLYTAARGRSGRGRVYVTGFTEAQWTSTGYEATDQSNVETHAAAVYAQATAINWVWGVCSHQINGVVRTPPILNAITSWNVRTGREGTQRRRVNRG